ncbi:DNA helicase UvrD [Candidatus Micrarchaeota archaeon]|nr:DNA helicase UvrD [Candidatus Micrarchaeota archaeon]
MRFIADLHLHSKYSRATSPRMDLNGIAEAAKLKGVQLMGSADFTHPEWFAELKAKLKESEREGFYEHNGVQFMLSAEVCNIFSVNKKVKKIHNLLFAPSLEVAVQVNEELAKRGNLSADGRPIFGMRASELVEITRGVSKDCEVVPAHAWTPWFGVFGANSGFDSLEECFEDQSKHIHALETGLSSDPSMNWRLSALDKITLISNSDSHSPEKIAREANVFDFEEKEFCYASVLKAIREKDGKRFVSTIEFFPEEGKYHFDGHRACGVVLKPSEAIALKNTCPVCRKQLTVGVLHRVEELADRKEGFVPLNSIPFKSLVPLREVVAKSLGKPEANKLVGEEYSKLVGLFGSELAVLEATREKLEECRGKTSERIIEGLVRASEGKITVSPGYDGVYGQVELFEGKKEK